MIKIVETVPNFSEGRNKNKIERIMAVFSEHPEIRVIGCEPDADYNRTVVTLLGDPDLMQAALFDFVKRVKEEVDLNVHSGQHPRMGAVDVIPFIPISGTTIKECVEYAKDLGKRVTTELDIPVFLYAEAATEESRIALPNIRKGEFEGMKTKIKDPLWHPDFGKSEIHPTFGVVAIGARQPLIAYNIDLATDDEKLAGSIAKAIRKSSGGYQFIQAGPASLAERGHVQVTMNILDYKKNPIYRIFETVRMEALRYHVEVTGAEIVGLLPREALERSIDYYFDVHSVDISVSDLSLEDLVGYAVKYLKFRDFDSHKIIEAYL